MSVAVADVGTLFFTLCPANSTKSTSVLRPGRTQAISQKWDIELSSFSNLPLPMSFPLQGTIAPGWEVVKRLLVTLEKDEDDGYIVSEDKFAVYGVGDTPTEATQDYIVSLIEYYQLLASKAESNQATKELFSYLQLYLRQSR